MSTYESARPAAPATRLEQLRPALHPAFALDQGVEQLEFGRREADLRAIHEHTVGHLVDQIGRALSFRRSRARGP